MAGEIPLFPLNTVLFPGGPLNLRIFEPRYLDMVGRCMRASQGFGVVLIREGGETGPAEFHETGTLARIVDFSQLPQGLLGLATIGVERFRVRTHRRQNDGLNVGEVDWLEAEPRTELPEEYAHLAEVLENLLSELGEEYGRIERSSRDASWVGYRLAEILPLTVESRQFCLELEHPLERLRLIDALITRGLK